jgi:hypothetical protein
LLAALRSIQVVYRSYRDKESCRCLCAFLVIAYNGTSTKIVALA